MKKVLLSLAVLAMVGCFASCKKNCDCSVLGVHYEYTVDELNDMWASFGEVNSCGDVWEVSEQTMKCE